MSLATKVDELMPRLHPGWKHLILEENLAKMTGIEVAQRILRACGRTDVKVCLLQDERNCYSPMLNWIGLSEDVAGSRSVMAAAIAAHEIGHAIQPKFEEKLCRSLKNSPLLHLGLLGELCILMFQVVREMHEWLKSVPLSERQPQDQGSDQRSQIHQFQQNLKLSKLHHQRHLSHLVIVLVKWGLILLLCPFYLTLYLTLGLAITIVIMILIPLSIFCALICRGLIFLSELHASFWAIRLLKQHKILDIHQQKAARKFLLAAALTYLGGCSIDRLFA
ncbi:MAG: zinc metallopeptidase [Aphanocapsa sp. GSE-SYN-MK-11-07L]|jgi:hypothetical protein|nr:zinc metallopeptidase [Aphanocapsa sp. GSE-SYN-MK-11-07L]